MCGIVGCVAEEPVAPLLLDGLRRVEYRGYDSAGMATISDGSLTVRKGAGRVEEIEKRRKLSAMKGPVGMAHTRWATHGGVTDSNAHPQTSCREAVAVVHNGIIDNYAVLKRRLAAEGHSFKSETDSEVIAHLVEEEYLRLGDPVKAVFAATRGLKGQYAVVVIFQDRPEVMVGARKDAPLIVGLGEGKNFLASDILAFIGQTDRAYFLRNSEVAEVRKDSVRVYGPRGREVVGWKPTQVAWELGELSKREYEHYTLKEIHEQPSTVARAAIQDGPSLSRFAATIRRAKSVVITAAGTSYHAGLLLKMRLNREARIPCDVVLAGEFQEHSEFVGKGTVVVALSQSGETADVLRAVAQAKSKGAKVVSIVNAAGSSLARESSVVLPLGCGPEVGVAATKSFTAQVVVVDAVVDALLGREAKSPKALARAVERALATEAQMKRLAERYRDAPDFYFVARGFHAPAALEGALKLKELSYIHAEGMAASELKHGTLALIDKGTPVVVVNPTGPAHEDTLSSAEELKARGADVIGVSDAPDGAYREFVRLPKVEEKYMPVVEVIPLQLLAYHVAVARQKNPDFPRNLAKSVTVK